MATTINDRIHDFIGVSVRVYGDRSGATFTLPRVGRAESTMRTTRGDAAKTIRAIRVEIRRLHAEHERAVFGPQEG